MLNEHIMKSRHFNVLLFFTALLVSGCQTSTRFGDILIPAHPDSFETSEEIVFEVVSYDTSKTIALAPLAITAANALVDVVKNKVADEFRNEAKKYTQQYSGKRRVLLDVGGSYVIMLRLIPGTPSESILNPATLDPAEAAILKVVKEAKTKYPKKVVASAVLFDVVVNETSDKKQYWGSVDLRQIYFSKAKAKVVGLSAWPWFWLGDVLLKTGDRVKVEVHARVRGITDKGPLTVLDAGMPEGGLQIRLGEPTVVSKFQLGDWTILGSHFGPTVPLSFEVLVTESDPSNIEKILNDSASKVDKSTFLNDLIPDGE